MTRTQHTLVSRYIRRIADTLRLADWTIILEDDPCHEHNDGYVQSTYGRKQARIWLRSDFVTQTPEEQRHTVVHELLHLHLDPSVQMLFDLPLAPQKAADVFEAAFRRHFEYSVDGIADAVAPLLPLPSFR